MGALPFPLLKNLSSIVPQNLRFFKGTSAFSGFCGQFLAHFSHTKGAVPQQDTAPAEFWLYLQLRAALFANA
jgi:hypothetical protein